MRKYLVDNFSTLYASTFASGTKAFRMTHRVFFYVPSSGDGAVNRKRPDRIFKELKGIKKLQCEHYSRARASICKGPFMLLHWVHHRGRGDL